MGYIPKSGSSVELTAYLTQKGKEKYLFNKSSLNSITHFVLGDSDYNYILDENINYTDVKIPDLTGDVNNCVLKLSKAIDGDYIRHNIKVTGDTQEDIDDGSIDYSGGYVESDIKKEVKILYNNNSVKNYSKIQINLHNIFKHMLYHTSNLDVSDSFYGDSLDKYSDLNNSDIKLPSFNLFNDIYNIQSVTQISGENVKISTNNFNGNYRIGNETNFKNVFNFNNGNNDVKVSNNANNGYDSPFHLFFDQTTKIPFFHFQQRQYKLLAVSDDIDNEFTSIDDLNYESDLFPELQNKGYLLIDYDNNVNLNLFDSVFPCAYIVDYTNSARKETIYLSNINNLKLIQQSNNLNNSINNYYKLYTKQLIKDEVNDIISGITSGSYSFFNQKDSNTYESDAVSIEFIDDDNIYNKAVLDIQLVFENNISTINPSSDFITII